MSAAMCTSMCSSMSAAVGSAVRATMGTAVRASREETSYHGISPNPISSGASLPGPGRSTQVRPREITQE